MSMDEGRQMFRKAPFPFKEIKATLLVENTPTAIKKTNEIILVSHDRSCSTLKFSIWC